MSLQSTPKNQSIHLANTEGKKSTIFGGEVTYRNNHLSSSHSLDIAECPPILTGLKLTEILACKIFWNSVQYCIFLTTNTPVFSIS